MVHRPCRVEHRRHRTKEHHPMIVTNPNAPLAFSVIRPTVAPALRPVTSPQVVPATEHRTVRRALTAGLAGATAFVVAIAR